MKRLLQLVVLFFAAISPPASNAANNDVPVRFVGKSVSVWSASAGLQNVVYEDGNFNHQPVVVHDLDDSYLVLWTGNPNSTKEGAPGQLVYASRSTDGGAHWSPRFAIFGMPTAQSQTQSEWQPRAARITTSHGPELWLAYNVGRGQRNQGAFLVVRTDAQGPLTAYRLVQDRDGHIVQIPAGETDLDASRFSPLWNLDGKDWFPFPQSIRQLADGTVLMTLTLIEPQTPFQRAAKRFAVMRFANGKWNLPAMAPAGDMSVTDAWESSIYQHPNGKLTAYIRSNDTSRQPGRRLAYSTSLDGGLSWSSCKWTRLAIHTEQPSIAQLFDGTAVLSMPDHSKHRNNQALSQISDDNLVQGLPVSGEADRQLFAHTSNVALDAQRKRLLVVWSESKVGETPRSIHFRRVDKLPSSTNLNLILRRNAEYELDTSSVKATWQENASVLELIGSASAGLQLPRERSVMQFTVNLVSSSHGAIVAALGDLEDQITWQLNKAASRLDIQHTKGTGSERTTKELGYISLDAKMLDAVRLHFVWDPATRTFTVRDANVPLTSPMPSFFLGDGFLANRSTTSNRLQIRLKGDVAFRCEVAESASACDMAVH